MINNIYRIIAVSLYPILLLLTAFSIFRKKEFLNVIVKNKKTIIINTLFITLLFSFFIIIFFSKEKAIYSWDYSGHWVRSLKLREIFFERPETIFKEIYNSMNYSDYSYLPALFTLPFSIINVSYTSFCLGNFICFIIPSFLLLQIMYYKYFDNKKYLPIIIFLIFYPLFFTIFEGKPCSCGLVFVSACYLIAFFQNIADIDTTDVLFINLFNYIAIFERRWYLYFSVAFYFAFLIRYLLSLKQINNKIKFLFSRIILSGIILLLVVIIFNRPFFMNALTNEYSTIYSTYDREGKLLEFINHYSIIIISCSIIGEYCLFKKNIKLFAINTISLIVSTVMFWLVQSFETHHYYISMINIIIPFSIFLYYFSYRKLYFYILSFILLIQSFLVFVDTPSIVLFTTKKRFPEVIDNIEDYSNLCTYMKNLLGKDEVAFICGSSSVFNEDIIRNSQLPDLDMPTFEYAQVDLVDGFPNNIDYIRYIIITNPIQFYDSQSQHVHQILNDAILYNDDFKSIYSLYDTYKLGDIDIYIYEKTGNYTQEMKEYLYKQIIQYYPENSEIFKEILE